MGRLKSPEGNQPDFDWEQSVTRRLAASDAVLQDNQLSLAWCTGKRQNYYYVRAVQLSKLEQEPIDCGGLAWQTLQKEGVVEDAWVMFFDSSKPDSSGQLETIEFLVAPDRPLQCAHISYPPSVQGDKYNDYWRDVEADVKAKMARGETIADDNDRQLVADAMQKLGVDSYMLIDLWPGLSDD